MASSPLNLMAFANASAASLYLSSFSRAWPRLYQAAWFSSDVAVASWNFFSAEVNWPVLYISTPSFIFSIEMFMSLLPHAAARTTEKARAERAFCMGAEYRRHAPLCNYVGDQPAG